MAVAYRIRPARETDAAALRAVEVQCFSDPWSVAGFREAMAGPLSLGLIAESRRGEIAGYLFARVVADEAEILNLAVAPARRRSGIGRELLARALADLAARGARTVFLEVRASNDGAMALYQSQGFRPLGRRRAYYRRPVEDAMVWGRTLEP